MWIRYGAVGFVAAVARTLNVADVHCNLLPRLQPFLKHPVVQVDQEVLKKIQSVQISITPNWGATLIAAPRWPWRLTQCSRVTRKSQFLHRNHVRGDLDFTGSENQSQYNFSRSTALELLFNRYVLGSISFVFVCTLSQKIVFLKPFCHEIKLSLEYFFLSEVI